MINSYAKSYTEVIEIINCLADEDYKKIPKDIIEYYKKNRDINYSFKIDPNLKLIEQNISIEAYSILVSIFRDYFATNKQKDILNTLLQQNQEKIEKDKKEKYNVENIFKNENKEIKKGKNIVEINSLIPYKKNIFQKIINKIKEILKK